MSDQITVNDVVIGTMFSVDLGDGYKKYEKGGMATAGKNGYTVCYPLLGGKIQSGPKFETRVPNDKPISLI